LTEDQITRQSQDKICVQHILCCYALQGGVVASYASCKSGRLSSLINSAWVVARRTDEMSQLSTSRKHWGREANIHSGAVYTAPRSIYTIHRLCDDWSTAENRISVL